MKIKLHSFVDSIGLQLFDRYFAYKQSFDSKKFLANFKIEIGPPEQDAINIAFYYMPQDKFCDFTQYDFVFVDNAGEALEVCSDYIAHVIQQPNVYFISGSFLSNQHKLFDKIIPFNHNIRLFHDCMTRGFYPQYYHRSSFHYDPIKTLAFVNGQNRSWRKYFLDLLTKDQTPIDIFSNFGQEIILETAHCVFEDTHDSEFRQQLDTFYPAGQICDYDYDYDYYKKSVQIGIDQKFGTVPIGYFLFDVYYKYHCVIFPESSWINNQHFATEKIYKCFVSGAIPFPISGAGTHQFYNTHGYQTAWNLLPAKLQEFDHELDHIKRYDKILEALTWLNSNSDIFLTPQAERIRQTNNANFYSNTLDVISVKKLDSVLQTCKKYHE
jgi:hypothetical protein